MAPVTGIDEVDAALRELWPEMSRQRWLVVLTAVAVTGVAGAISLGIYNAGGEPGGVAIPLMAPAILIPLMIRWLRMSHERAVLPVIAKAAGMDYSKEAGKLRGSLPQGLLPRHGGEKNEDTVTYQVGGRSISSSEVHIETGGKHNTVYFDGFIVNVPNLSKAAPFTLALHKETTPGFLSAARQDISGLRSYDSYTRYGRSYGIWGPHVAEPPMKAIRAYIDKVFTAEHGLSGDDGIYSVVRTERETVVAIRHKRDLYVLGGVLAGPDRMAKDIARAFEDLRLPLRVAEALIAAEAELAPSAGAAPGSRSA